MGIHYLINNGLLNESRQLEKTKLIGAINLKRVSLISLVFFCSYCGYFELGWLKLFE